MGRTKAFFEKRKIYVSVAVLAGMTLFTFFLCIARFGIKNVDESFYLSIPYRLMNGDSLFTDEWHVSQLSGLLLLLPMKLFLLLTGSADGIILFFRQLYAVIKLIFYGYICYKLRREKYWGIFAAVLFSVFDYLQYAVLNYYTMTAMGAVIVGFILFDPNGLKPNRGKLVFAGIVVACMVLAEPPAALLYFLYAETTLVFFLLRRKKKNVGAYPFDGNTFWFLTAGIFIVFAVFAVYFLCTVDIGEFAKNFPMLFTDSEYRFGADGGNVLEISAIGEIANLLGIVPLCLCAVLFFAGTVFVKRRKLPVFVVFTGHLLLFACELIRMLVKYSVGLEFLIGSTFFPLLFSFFGLACFTLTEKKEKGLLTFWLFVLLLSLPVDIGSACAVFSCLCVSCIPSVLMIKNFFAECQKRNAEKKYKVRSGKKYIAALTALTLCVSAVSLSCYLYERTEWTRFEIPAFANASQASEKGPLKGIYTASEMKNNYELALEDLDYIKSVSDGMLYVANLCPWYYFYTGLDVGTYTAYYVEADGIDRNRAYWELHPEKIPDTVFVPFFDAADYRFPKDPEKLFGSKIFGLFDGDVKKLNTGYLIEHAKYKG